MKWKRYLHTRTILSSVALLLGCTILLQSFCEGLFFDGLAYASISRNLSEGNGSLFDLFYSETIKPHFRETMPLFCWLESLFFFIFGDHFFIEKLFCLVLFLLALFLLVKLWRITNGEEHSTATPLLLLLFCLNPKIIWVYSNNMTECLLIPLVLLFSVIAFNKRSYKPIAFHFLLLFVFLAIVFTKGPMGMFVLTLLPVPGFVQGDLKSRLTDLIILLCSSGVALSLFYLNNSAFRLFFNDFLENQVIKSALGLRESTGSHFSFVPVLLNDFLLLIIALPLLLWMKHKKKRKNVQATTKNAFTLWITGFSLPFACMVTTKQADYYFAPAYSLIYLGYFLYFKKELEQCCIYLMHRFGHFRVQLTNLSLVFLIAFLVTVDICRYNAPSRDAAFIKDVKKLNHDFPGRGLIPATQQCLTNWCLVGYLERKYNRSLRNMTAADKKFISLKTVKPE